MVPARRFGVGTRGGEHEDEGGEGEAESGDAEEQDEVVEAAELAEGDGGLEIRVGWDLVGRLGAVSGVDLRVVSGAHSGGGGSEWWEEIMRVLGMKWRRRSHGKGRGGDLR